MVYSDRFYRDTSPTYVNGVREDRIKDLAPHTIAYWLNRAMDAEDALGTEQVCMAESRDSYERQIQGQFDTIQKLNDEMTKLRETKDWSLLTQLRDENRDLHKRLSNQATIIQAAQVHTDRLTKVLCIDAVDAQVYGY